MKVDAVHIEPFDFIQKVEFRLSRSDAFQLLMNLSDAKLQVLCLSRHEAEFWYVSVCVLARLEITDLGWE